MRRCVARDRSGKNRVELIFSRQRTHEFQSRDRLIDDTRHRRNADFMSLVARNPLQNHAHLNANEFVFQFIGVSEAHEQISELDSTAEIHICNGVGRRNGPLESGRARNIGSSRAGPNEYADADTGTVSHPSDSNITASTSSRVSSGGMIRTSATSPSVTRPAITGPGANSSSIWNQVLCWNISTSLGRTGFNGPLLRTPRFGAFMMPGGIPGIYTRRPRPRPFRPSCRFLCRRTRNRSRLTARVRLPRARRWRSNRGRRRGTAADRAA